jgi:hypothetical protein
VPARSVALGRARDKRENPEQAILRRKLSTQPAPVSIDIMVEAAEIVCREVTLILAELQL